MMPPIYDVCRPDTTLQSLIPDPGAPGELKLYPFGEAPEKVLKPYAVWQLIAGGPENYLSNAPDVDQLTIQIDVYAESASNSRQIAIAIRAIIEAVAHVTRYNGEWRDPDTRSYRCSFTVDWFVNR